VIHDGVLFFIGVMIAFYKQCVKAVKKLRVKSPTN